MGAIRIKSAFVLFTCIAGNLSAQGQTPSQYKVTEFLAIAGVVSDFRVGFRLLTAGERQFAAYYDKRARKVPGDNGTWLSNSEPSFSDRPRPPTRPSSSKVRVEEPIDSRTSRRTKDEDGHSDSNCLAFPFSLTPGSSPSRFECSNDGTDQILREG